MKTVTQLISILIISVFLIFITTFFLQQNMLNDSNMQHANFPNKISKVAKYNNKDNTIKLEGYVVSVDDARFNNIKPLLNALGIEIHQHVPHPFDSEVVLKAIEEFPLGWDLDIKIRGKCMSNRMAFFDLVHNFANDKNAKNTSWRLIFEDDADLHPSLKPSQAQKAIQEGLRLAADDGAMFMGVCMPVNCTDNRTLTDSSIVAAKCTGICAHALAFTKWKAKIIASLIDELLKPGNPHRTQNFDEMLQFYSIEHKILALGLNLKSPIPDVYEHYGLFFQNRGKFPSFINEGLQL